MFLAIVVEHLSVNFGDSSCIRFWDIVLKNRWTVVKALAKPLPLAWVMTAVAV